MEKKFELKSCSHDLAQFRQQLKELLSGAGFNEKKSGEVTLAVDEALTNIIRHGYGHEKGRVEVAFHDYQDRVEIRIRDFGKKFDPTKVAPPKLPPTKPGGLGIYFIHTLMDKVEYQSLAPDTNELHLTKMKI
ncbi:MAG TPA: ATP-binding protein [Verrucomicrobiae bacterium]|jgi:serine/threonine-protein kinase RsbW|nr:ATP-binding protein [Verrucomicrobiae bacterium]